MNGIIIDELSNVELPVQSGDEFPIERGQAMYKVEYDDLIGNNLSAINGDISDLQTNVNSLQSNATKAQTSINALESGIAIIVNGNSAAQTVPSGGYAYLKNNQYGLAEGLYINTNSADFPTGSSVAATSSYFSAVSGGGLNAVKIDKSCTLLGTTSSLGDITTTEPFRNYYFLYVVAGGYGYQVVKLFPVDVLEASQVFMIAGGYENDAYSYRIGINSDGATLRLENKGSAITSPVKVYGIWHK